LQNDKKPLEYPRDNTKLKPLMHLLERWKHIMMTPFGALLGLIL
jgi:hypothetical protein